MERSSLTTTLFLILVLFPLHTLSSFHSKLIQELLDAHGLPVGLFPKTIESFAMDTATGLLEVRLDKPCYVRFGYNGWVFFNQVLRGNLSYGELTSMEGFSQQELFLWLPINRVIVPDPSSHIIIFDVAPIQKQLALYLFDTPPECKPSKGDAHYGRIVGIKEQK